jgi:hypothetical protein
VGFALISFFKMPVTPKFTTPVGVKLTPDQEKIRKACNSCITRNFEKKNQPRVNEHYQKLRALANEVGATLGPCPTVVVAADAVVMPAPTPAVGRSELHSITNKAEKRVNLMRMIADMGDDADEYLREWVRQQPH